MEVVEVVQVEDLKVSVEEGVEEEQEVEGGSPLVSWKGGCRVWPVGGGDRTSAAGDDFVVRKGGNPPPSLASRLGVSGACGLAHRRGDGSECCEPRVWKDTSPVWGLGTAAEV